MVAKNHDGQAIFEFIMFMPFMLFALGLIITFGNSINNSINQQKATRAYQFFLTNGNSYVIPPSDLVTYQRDGRIKFAGGLLIGWRETSNSGEKDSYMTCVKLPRFLEGTLDEDCLLPQDNRDLVSSNSDQRLEINQARELSGYIKIGTMYGLCGQSYFIDNNIRAITTDFGMGSCSLVGQ